MSSKFLANGMGVSILPILFIGASKYSKQFSEISSEMS